MEPRIQQGPDADGALQPGQRTCGGLVRGLVARSDTELLQVAALELSWRIVDSAAAAYSRFNEPRIRGRERHMQAAHGIHAAGTRERRREVFQHVHQTELLQVSDARAQL